MIIATAIIGFSVFIAVTFYILLKGGVAKAILNPIFLSFLLFLLIHTLLPVMQEFSGYYRYGSYLQESVVYTILYCILFQIFFACTVFLFKNDSVPFGNYNFNIYRFKVLFFTAVLCFFVAVYFIYKNIAVIFLMGQSEYMKDRISLGVGQGFQILISHWVYISCVLFFIVYIVSHKNKFKILFLGSKCFFVCFLFSLLVNVFYYSINSNRNSLFVLFLLLVFFYFSFSSSIQRRSLKQDVKFSLVVFLVVFFVGFGFHYLGQLRHDTVVNSQNSDYGIEKSLNGAFGNHENLLWLYQNDFEYSLGSTYVAGFLNVIPRSLWADKPTGAGPVLKNMIYPGDYVVGKRGNSSLTTGFITEAVMNFGFFGAFVLALVWGGLVAKIYSLFYKAVNPGWKILHGYLLVLFTTQFYYAEFLGFISRTLFTLIPIIIYLAIVGFSYKGIFNNETNSARHG